MLKMFNANLFHSLYNNVIQAFFKLKGEVYGIFN